MRRKPSASHCVKKPPPLVYRPDSWVFFSGAQVLRISSVKRSAFGRVVDHQLAAFVRNDTLSPSASTRSRFRPSPCRRSGCAGTAAVALDRAAAGDDGLGRVEVEGQFDAADPVGRRA
jgi:hypothetical protein